MPRNFYKDISHLLPPYSQGTCHETVSHCHLGSREVVDSLPCPPPLRAAAAWVSVSDTGGAPHGPWCVVSWPISCQGQTARQRMQGAGTAADLAFVLHVRKNLNLKSLLFLYQPNQPFLTPSSMWKSKLVILTSHVA